MEKTDTRNNLSLKIAPFVSALALIVYVVSVLVSQPVNSRTLICNIFFAVPVAIANFLIMRAYVTHNKNLMKSMIGFILSGLVMLSMHYAFVNLSGWYFVVKAAMFGIIVLFTVNQFLLSHSHYSRPAVLFANQILMNMLTVASIVATIVEFKQSGSNPFIFISLLVFVLASMFLVLRIEMRVNEFKVKREAKGYVFEKGTVTENTLDEEDMFISDKVFCSLPWIVLAGLVCNFAFNAIFDTAINIGYSIRYMFYVVKAICLFAAIASYKSHNKDIMKVMNGFLLGMLLFENIYEVTFLTTSSVSVKSVLTALMVLFNLFFLIAHSQLTRPHSSTKVIKLMKAVYIVYTLAAVGLVVGCQISYLIGKGNNYQFFLLKPIFWAMGTYPVVTGILTIDTRVNGYKVNREKKK